MVSFDGAKAYIQEQWTKFKDVIIALLGLVTLGAIAYAKIEADKNVGLKNAIQSANTQKEAAELQTQIEGHIAAAIAAGQQADDLKALAAQLEEKRKSLPQTDATDGDVTNFYKDELK